MMELTISNEHYIKAVYELEHDGEGARISDIAKRLNVTKSSVCVAMKAPQQKRLITRDVNRRVIQHPKEKIRLKS